MIREATAADLSTVRDLFRAFELEVPEPAHRDSDAETDLAALEGGIGRDVVLLAERDGLAVGLAVAKKTGTRTGFLDVLYVRAEARRDGIARELVRETAARLRSAAPASCPRCL